jgi:hypothetical protein
MFIAKTLRMPPHATPHFYGDFHVAGNCWSYANFDCCSNQGEGCGLDF